MKTQFLVTFHQAAGGETFTAATLAGQLRELVRQNMASETNRVTVRHLTEDQPTPTGAALISPAALQEALAAAHRAGQQTGRLLGKDSRDRASAYAAEAAMTLGADPTE